MPLNANHSLLLLGYDKKKLVFIVAMWTETNNYKLPDEETDDLTKPYEQFNVNPMS